MLHRGHRDRYRRRRMAPFGDAVGLIARSEVRARWRALLGLALLVALVGAVALSALAGARRSGSALDRFVAPDKPDFVGRDALLRQRDAGIARRLVPLVVETCTPYVFSTAWPAQRDWRF